MMFSKNQINRFKKAIKNKEDVVFTCVGGETYKVNAGEIVSFVYVGLVNSKSKYITYDLIHVNFAEEEINDIEKMEFEN